MKTTDKIHEEVMRLDGLQQKFADLCFTHESWGHIGKSVFYNSLAQFMFRQKCKACGWY